MLLPSRTSYHAIPKVKYMQQNEVPTEAEQNAISTFLDTLFPSRVDKVTSRVSNHRVCWHITLRASESISSIQNSPLNLTVIPEPVRYMACSRDPEDTEETTRTRRFLDGKVKDGGHCISEMDDDGKVVLWANMTFDNDRAQRNVAEYPGVMGLSVEKKCVDRDMKTERVGAAS